MIMSLGNTDIQGSASVSRHVNVGGNADVRGHLSVGHNLRVAGWVDAPHIKGALKGLYASEEALVRAYPRPMPGWYALVGDALPADVWRAENGKWVPTGEQGGEPELWLDDLQERMDEAEEAIEAESEARKAADMSLAASIAAEADARQAGDAALAGRIDSEAAAREAADADLAESIAAEEAAREAADVELAGSVAAETEAREKADAAILGSVDIGDLDSVTVSQGMAAVLGRGPHRYNVMDDGKVVGTLEVIGDEMLHVFSQVLTTHRLIEDGKLANSHRDDRVFTYYRSMGLRDSGGITPGEWTRWRRSGGGNAEMAVEVDPDTGDVALLYEDDGELPLADAYINERGEIVLNFEF